MNKSALLIAVLLLSAPARAIELSLEENRGERGSVGYVDMQRLFTNSPDALRAKEGFEDLVRQAEERVNLRKAELVKLRQSLDAARLERDALAHSMSLEPVPSTAAAAPAPAPIPAQVPAASTAAAAAPSPAPAPAAAAPAAPALSPAAAALLTGAPNPVAGAAPASAPAPAAHARELALPGMATTGTEPSAPPAAPVSPAASTAAAVVNGAPNPVAAAAPAAAPAVSTAAVSAAAAMFPAPAPAPAVAQAPAGPTPAQRLLELDAKIIAVQADIARKENDLTQEHDDADRGLLDVESRKTDQVLARLYRAVSEVARREGVSVVIDKTSILYGHPAVDLTDKVLKYLKENLKETPVQ
jgi:Skp family chaperone for outer membrane proteins